MSGIAVLGLGRSGTAFVTEALEHCGAFVGRVNWAYEHKDVRAINDDLLTRFCGAQRGSRPYGDWQEFEISDEARSAAADVVASLVAGARNHGTPWWAIKDPRLTLLTDLWLPHVEFVVAVFRHPAAAIASYLGHNFVRGPQAFEITKAYWLLFNRRLLQLQETGTKPMYFVEFKEPLLPDLRRLTRGLRLPFSQHVHFDPERVHFRASDFDQEILAATMTPEIEQVYAALQQRVEGDSC
jgi:hypothetical protein